jgi:hypothetical protein
MSFELRLRALPRGWACLISFVLFVGPAAAVAQDRTVSLDDFAWMEGSWQGMLDVGDGLALAEVRYSAPRAGIVVGSFRLSRDGAVLVVELLTLVEVEDGIEMRLRHFSDRLDPWEQGDPVILTLDGFSDGRFTFRNHVDDSPRWSFLVPDGPDTFLARSEIYSDTGEMSEIRIEYERVNPPPGG